MKKVDPKALPLASRITDGLKSLKMGWATYGALSTFWRIEGLPGLYSCRSRPPSGFPYVVAAYKVPVDGRSVKLAWSKFVRELTIEKMLGLL